MKDTILLKRLQSVQALLKKPGVWVKGYYALTTGRLATGTRSSDACHFCLVGAIENQTQPSETKAVLECIYEAARTTPEAGWGLTVINDGGGYKVVMSLLAKAIKNVKKRISSK